MCARFIYKKNNDFEFITNIGHQAKDLYLSCFGRCATPPEYRYGPAIRAYDLIHVILRGRGTLLLDQTEYNIQAGQAFFIPKGITADYFADAYDPWEYVWIGYDGSIVALFDRETGFSLDHPVQQVHVKSKVFEDMFNEILPFTTLSISDELYRTGWLYRMLSLFTNAGPPSLLKSTDASDKQSPERIIRTAENYIRRNYNSITVSELAASLQVARSHLFKVFKKHFGISPQQYIMEMRFKHALTLLADSRLPVKQIALDSGFGDSQNFSKQFKKHIGVSPHIYRNTQKGEKLHE